MKEIERDYHSGKFNPNDSESVHRYSSDYISKTKVYKINSSTGRKNKVKPNGGEEAVVIAHCLKYNK